MVARPLFAALCAAVVLSSPALAQTAISCSTETDAEVSRRVCVAMPADGGVRLAPPETPPPLTTRNGAGLGFSLHLPLPPEAIVIIPPQDLAPVAPPPPPRIVVLVPPPAPPPAAELPPPAPPPARVETPVAPQPVPPQPFPPMPAEALDAALRRLRAGGRISEREAEDALAFYRARDFRPLWLEDGRWGERAQALRGLFATAGEHGLDPARYRTVAQFVPAGEPQWPALAAAEARMTEAALVYARDAAIGRIKPAQVAPLITPALQHATADKVLAELAEAQDVAGALASFHPPHPQYVRLKAALAASRARRPAVDAGEPIPDGPLLRIGMRDARVPLIRERLGLGYDGNPVYDREVSIRVAGLQRANGLPVNGAFTAQTRRVLAGEAATPEEAEIVANMEFWRWLPRDLGEEHIFVNTPAYDLQLRRGGRTIHHARVIVGKAETQTPVFSDVMDHIVVNPSWYIPPGILKREPKYLDPAYAEARGYEIRTRGGVTTVRVPPSSANALGYVKFMFPNDHAVYLHDTPSRGLFNARVRTLSNGCVRVENPMRLAAMLFPGQGGGEERFLRMQGGGEKRMNLPRKTPVHLGYFTMTVGEDGAISRHPDVYGHMLRLRQILGMS